MRMKTEAMRQTLMEAASAVFLEQGFDRTLMSDISARAGCSKGTLYSYFKSKEELFFEVVIGGTEQECQAVVLVLDKSCGSLDEALQRFGESFLSLLYSPRFQALRRLTFCDNSKANIGRRVFEHGVKQYQGMVANFLALAMEQGELRTVSPEVAADHLCGLLESELLLKFLLKVLDEVTANELARIAKRAVNAFLGAYRL